MTTADTSAAIVPNFDIEPPIGRKLAVIWAECLALTRPADGAKSLDPGVWRRQGTSARGRAMIMNSATISRDRLLIPWTLSLEHDSRSPMMMWTWRDGAACLDESPELFFPVGTTYPALLQADEAKLVCRRCEVVDACLSWAIESGQEAGVWGGLAEDERHALKRRNARAHRAGRVAE